MTEEILKNMLIKKLNKIINEKAKLHFTDVEKISIKYENGQFFYLVDTGAQIEKRILNI